MAKITHVSSCTVRVPLARTAAFSSRVVEARDYTLVRIERDDGQQGIGFCYSGHRAGDLATQAIRQLLAPMLLEEDPYRVEGLWRKLYEEALLHGRTGVVMRALSALDIALWDGNARAADLPLYRFLGAYHEQSVPAYASGGYYKQDKGPEQLAEEVANYVDLGFRAVKIKVGRGELATEEKRIAAVREAIGPDVLLMLDANNIWRDLPTALRFVRVFEAYDPYWIEEPFSPDDLDNHYRLSQRTPVPIATGEIEAGRWQFARLLERGAAQVLQPDAAVCGGITEFRRIAALAASHSVPICPHWLHDLHAHLVATDPQGRFVEYFPDTEVLNFSLLIDKQIEHEGGKLLLPNRPGLGFSFSERAVSRYTVTQWN